MTLSWIFLCILTQTFPSCLCLCPCCSHQGALAALQLCWTWPAAAWPKVSPEKWNKALWSLYPPSPLAKSDARAFHCDEFFLNYKAGPNSVSKNHISFRCKKRTPKLASCTFFLLCWCKRSRFQSMQSRRFKARRGLGEATPRTQNVLAQGQSDAHGDSKLYNTIVEVPASAELFVVGACAAKPKKYRMKQSWRQASMQVFFFPLVRPITLWGSVLSCEEAV